MIKRLFVQVIESFASPGETGAERVTVGVLLLPNAIIGAAGLGFRLPTTYLGLS